MGKPYTPQNRIAKKAVSIKAAFETNGHAVKEVVVEGNAIRVVFYGPDDDATDFDLVDMRV